MLGWRACARNLSRAGRLLPFEPFESTFAGVRVVAIPESLSGELRAKFVDRIRKAVEAQASLAAECDNILRVERELREDGDRILITHEPAASVNLDAVLTPDEQADISTLSWLTVSCLKALATAEKARIVHGGIQPRSVLIDRVGRIKLADFGLTPVFAELLAPDAWRYLVCEPDAEGRVGGRHASAVWSLLDESQARDSGWIVPFSALEIVTGEQRLNSRADQFSLGAVLYQFATALHPYGAELSDPTLDFYLHLEPYALEDERTDWADIFERGGAGIAVSADKPVLAWAETTLRLLAAEASERFETTAKALEAAAEHASPKWDEAATVLGESVELIDEKQFDPLLTTLGPWSEDPELPELWRARLAAMIQETERLKAEEQELGELRALASQGATALEALQLEEARACAEKIQQHPNCNDDLREIAEKLLADSEVAQREIADKAEQVAREYLALARDALDAEQFDAAREYLSGVIGDEMTPEQPRRDAETMLAEADAAIERLRKGKYELDAATSEFEQRQFDNARTRLERLVGDAALPKTVAEPAGALLAQTVEAQALQEKAQSEISEIEQALRDGDLDAAESRLEALADKLDDPELTQRSAALAERLRISRQAEIALAEARALFAKDDAQAALSRGRAIASEAGVGDTIVQAARELVASCEEAIASKREAELRDAGESLRAAQLAYEAGDVEACLAALEPARPFAQRLSEHERALINDLPSRCERLQRASSAADAAQQALAARDPDAAAAGLDSIDVRELPTAAGERVATLRAQAEALRNEINAERIREVELELEEFDQAVASAALDRARELIAAAAPHAKLSERISERIGRSQGRLAELSAFDASLAAIDAAIGENRPGKASRLCDELVDHAAALEQPPSWLAERIDKARSKVEQAAEQARAAAHERAAAALEAAHAALGNCDAAVAETKLSAVEDDIPLAPDLQPRFSELKTLAARIAEWLPRIESLKGALERNDLAGFNTQYEEARHQDGRPRPIESRLKSIADQAAEKIRAHRAALATALEACAGELSELGRRAKKFRARVEHISQDALAPAELQTRASELIAQFEALPKPRPPVALWAVGAAIVVLVAGGGYWMTRGNGGSPPPMSPDDGQNSGDTTPVVRQPQLPTPTERIAAALAAFEKSFAQAAPRAAADGRARPNWRFQFEPPDAFDTELVATDADSGVNTRFGPYSADQIETPAAALTPGQPLWEALFPKATPDDAQTIGEALASLTAAYQQLATRAAPDGWSTSGELVFTPATEFPTTLLLDNGSGERTKVGDADSASALAELEQRIAALKPGDAEWAALFAKEPPAAMATALPAALKARTVTDPDEAQVRGVLDRLLPDLQRDLLQAEETFLARICDQLRISDDLDDQQDVATLRVGLRAAGADAESDADFSLRLSDDKWNASQANAAAFDAVFNSVVSAVGAQLAAAADEIDRGRIAGALVQARAAADAQAELHASLLTLPAQRRPAEALSRFDTARGKLFAPFSTRAAAANSMREQGPRDPDLDYPRRLERNGRTFYLVHVAAADPIWNAIAQASGSDAFSGRVGAELLRIARLPEAQRPWFLFYVDAEERAEDVGNLVAARDLLTTDGLSVPSAEQWLLAALKLSAQPGVSGFIGGRWDWADAGGAAWVCGGADALHRGNLALDAGDVAARWRLLNNPLVSQPRAYGDGLAGVRGVWNPRSAATP